MTAPALPPLKPGYFHATRSARYSILFALPLLVLYEVLAAMLSSPAGGGLRNGADALFRMGFSALAGAHGPLVFMTAVVLIGVYLVAADIRRARDPLRPHYFSLMMGESALLAMAFGVVIGTVTARLLGAVELMAVATPQDIHAMSWPMRLMLSLGAGLYEELFFRVVLVSGLTALGTVVFGWKRTTAVVFAVVLSAILFSLFHYIPPYGDPLELASFTFRLLAGLAFSALYVARGFGITAWTHALYDVFLLLF